MILLRDYLKDMVLSKEGSSIIDDINNCKKVVSFSLDANIEVTKMRKPFVYIWDGQSDNDVEKLNCATRDNYKKEIQKLMSLDFYSSFSEDQYKEILGDTDVENLHKKFVSYIKR